ncbi:MAG: lamin tail domain-containing protein, partial [Planctomycetes bacterium]|nr:lamin tail domain-containing protein [Planctomycetota bacterium]
MLTKHLFGLALLCLAFAGASTLSGQYVATQVTNDYNVLDISGTGTDQTGNFVASGSALGVDDEGVVNNVAMGFTFDFYGNSYTTINISVNGYLTFSPITASTYTRPTSTPNAAVPNNYIAGAWFDGGGSGAWGATAKVYTQTFGTSPNSEFRVQFVNWERYNNTGSNSFLYRVFEDGSIEVHYGTCDAFAATGASTAVENSTGTIGTASVGGFTRNTTPTQADRFAPPQNPTAAPATGSAFTGSTTAGFDATVDTGVALSNFSISCNDPNNATIDATITTSGAAPGVTQPADVTAGTVAFTLTWTGTGSSAGTYTYNVTLDDGTLQTSFDVRITITSPAPLLSAPYAPPPSSAIQITEIALDPGTSGDEYCEIQNVSSAAVTLTNWTITVWDGSTTPDFTNTINTVTLQPGDTYIFCDNGSATFPAANQGFSANLLWDGTNCGAMVQDDSGNIVDCVFWGNMNVPTITQPLAIGSEWVGASLATISINSGYERGGTADNDDASDWTVQTTDSIGGTNSGLTLPFTTSGTTMIGGTDPSFTGTAIVGDSLEVTFTATDTSTTQTLTYTITRTGGTLTAAAAGFNQTFTAGVYNDPAPGTTPHSLTLDGTAATVGTITFDVLVSDGALTDTYSYALTIDPPPPAEINLQNGSAANVLTGTTDTIATSIPAGFQ